ncbi:uncharacterized protein [Primulina eburnea]|uniref:uncharacterized protein n=1 Tax=Primulina eburnea TaxID=1245227 RepID=UPI003C6BFC0F
MAPYEALYGRNCRSPLYWDEVGEKFVTGPELVQLTVDKVSMIKERLKAAQDRQKSWADLKRRPLKLEIGKKAYVKVSPMKGVLRKYVPDSSHVFQVTPLMIEGKLNEELKYEEVPTLIVDSKDQVLRNRIIPYVKVQWSNHTEKEVTWELDEKMRTQYPHLFERSS